MLGFREAHGLTICPFIGNFDAVDADLSPQSCEWVYDCKPASRLPLYAIATWSLGLT